MMMAVVVAAAIGGIGVGGFLLSTATQAEADTEIVSAETEVESESEVEFKAESDDEEDIPRPTVNDVAIRSFKYTEGEATLTAGDDSAEAKVNSVDAITVKQH